MIACLTHKFRPSLTELPDALTDKKAKAKAKLSKRPLLGSVAKKRGITIFQELAADAKTPEEVFDSLENSEIINKGEK